MESNFYIVVVPDMKKISQAQLGLCTKAQPGGLRIGMAIPIVDVGGQQVGGISLPDALYRDVK